MTPLQPARAMTMTRPESIRAADSDDAATQLAQSDDNDAP